MNRLTALSKHVASVLRRVNRPLEMRTIVELAVKSKRFQDIGHRRIWNAIHNGCAYPTEKPRFKKVIRNGKTLFSINK